MENVETNEAPSAVLEKAEDAPKDRPRRASRKDWAWTRRLLRTLWLTAGLARRLLVTAVLVLSLLFNGLLIFSDAAQTAVAAAASAVGLRTVAARQADNVARTSAMLAAERDASRKIQTTLDETRKERDAARKQARDADRTLAAERDASRKTQATLDETRKERDAARKQARNADRTKVKLAEVQRESDVNRQRVKDTAERVNRRIQRAAAREVAVMPAEAIPVFGASAIVAATAWELRDMCETVKDMTELERAFDSERARAAEVPTVCSKEVPDRKELLEKAMSAPAETWESVRAALDNLGSAEIAENRLPEILNVPQDAFEWSKGAWEGQMKNFELWWHGRQ